MDISSVLKEVIYAFQDKRIVMLIAHICGLKKITLGNDLYAGGIVVNEKGWLFKILYR